MQEDDLKKTLDANSAAHVRLLAEIEVLRRFVAQLYQNCSNQHGMRIDVYHRMKKAADQMEQKWLENLEATQPGAVARIDANRPAVDSSEDVLPPAW